MAVSRSGDLVLSYGLAIDLNLQHSSRLDLECLLALFSHNVSDDRGDTLLEQLLQTNVGHLSVGGLCGRMNVRLIIHDPLPRHIVFDVGQILVPLLGQKPHLTPERQHVLIDG